MSLAPTQKIRVFHKIQMFRMIRLLRPSFLRPVGMVFWMWANCVMKKISIKKSCQDFGFFGGALSCLESCQFDFSLCEDPPSEVEISGVDLLNPSHGQTITISGSGFGAKDPAPPHLWDDFEGHSAGGPIGLPIIGAYTRLANVQYDSEAHWSGSMSAKSVIRVDSEGAPGLVSHWIDKGPSQNGFASMKWRIAGDVGPHNIKLLRLNAHYPDGDATHGYPNYNIGNDRGYTNFRGIINHGSTNQRDAGGFSEYSSSWNSIQIYDHLGTQGVANGFIGRRLNGELETREDVMTFADDAHVSGLRSAYFCGYFSHDGSDADVWLDDVYADTTLARIEIVGPSGIREMQIPETWSDTEITATFNAGAYVNGTEVRIYVYNSGNHASNGFTVTVGE